MRAIKYKIETNRKQDNNQELTIKLNIDNVELKYQSITSVIINYSP